jgi:hypothetical protein
MGKSERSSPRLPSETSILLLGRNSRGHWVVHDRRHQCGGIFFNCADAIKFALFENRNRPRAVIIVPGILELDMSGETGVAAKPALSSKDSVPRRAA